MLSDAEHAELVALPTSIVAFEAAIDDIVAELGGNEFRDMTEVKGMCRNSITLVSYTILTDRFFSYTYRSTGTRPF